MNCTKFPPSRSRRKRKEGGLMREYELQTSKPGNTLVSVGWGMRCTSEKWPQGWYQSLNCCARRALAPVTLGLSRKPKS